MLWFSCEIQRVQLKCLFCGIKPKLTLPINFLCTSTFQRFFLEIEVQTFSISRKATYLCMQCCRWEDLVTGRYTCNWGIQLPLVLAFCTDKMWHASSLLSDMKSRDIDAAHFAAVTNPVKNHYKRMLDYFVNCSANAAAEIFNVKIKAFRGAVIKIRLNLLWLLNYLFSIMYFSCCNTTILVSFCR